MSQHSNQEDKMSLGASKENRRPVKEPLEKSSTRVITIVFIALLIDLLGFTLILPLFPSILDHYSKNDDGFYMTLQHGVDWFAEVIGMPAERKYNSVLFGGLIGSIFSILQFFASPLTGATSDYFGRRPIMLLTVIGLIASYSLWAISRSFEIFLFSRIVGGISKGNVSLSTAIIADLQCPKARSKGMVSSVMSGFQSAAGLLSPWALFQFSAVSQRMDPPSKETLKILGLVYFLYLFLFSGLEYTLSFLVHQHFQFSSMEQGKMFFFIGITMAVIQGGYTRQIKPGNEVKTVKRAIMLSVPAFLLIGWSTNLIILSAGLLFYSFAAAVVVPCMSTVVSGYGSVSQKGTVMGILRSLGALARAFGPIMSATVYWLAGAEVCFTLCASLFLLPLILLGCIQEQTKEE
ncbi:major facilitator superfamily domain-containing protein 10 isoform X3 [Hemicordylus capensis]|uniref:major facilitator superfamily domain-containing protein 10 isoform X3 n=1 Tax=Hemicordylus capensis TaxID=884348 RepID=UPI002303C415|nr:major facilitator superfamily domain-containing protein 10 isoform X3 [Hemicordylus capensis]